MSLITLDVKQQGALLDHVFKKNVVRLGTNNEYLQRRDILADLQQEVESGKYSPQPHGFLSQPKGTQVARFIPVFSYRDYAVFFACVKSFDEKLASLAVEGTFGGWSLGGAARKVEEKHVKSLFVSPGTTLNEDDIELIDASMPASSFNPLAWVKEWNQYWVLLSALLDKAEDGSCFVMFDIANFYDSIDLPGWSENCGRSVRNTALLLKSFLTYFLHGIRT
jgi:hypothetical protein